MPIVVSEKCDGGNTAFERSGIFARTHAHEPSHPSFDILKSLHASLRYSLPEHYQFFGENVYAKHSIAYSGLPGYFLLFNIRDLNEPRWSNQCWLHWDDVEMWAQNLAIPTVPVLFKGVVHSEKELQKLTEELAKQPSKLGGEREGVVVRVEDCFSDDEFGRCVAKWVKKDFVQTSIHWSKNEVVRNGLK